MANFTKARTAALDLLKNLGIESPPINPVEICKSMGVEVKFVVFKEGFSNISGFYDFREDSIYINEEEYPVRQTFTIAHELGHRTLHKEWAKSNEYKVMMRGDPDSNNCYEQEANEFAGHLLAPRFILDEYADQLKPFEMSKLFAISVPTVNIRMSKEYGI